MKKGANITFSNRYNQNALMIALSRESYNVCDYILPTPELRDKIDYRQSDDKGVTVTGIIDIKLRETKEKESIDDQLMKQLAGETKGKARSDTKYDAFSEALQNAIKKGNIENNIHKLKMLSIEYQFMHYGSSVCMSYSSYPS